MTPNVYLLVHLLQIQGHTAITDSEQEEGRGVGTISSDQF